MNIKRFIYADVLILILSLPIFASVSGTVVTGYSYYTRSSGTEMINRYFYSNSPGVINSQYQRFSNDNGDTWGDPADFIGGESVAILDSSKDLLVNMSYADFGYGTVLTYTISMDGGHSIYHFSPVIHKGGYSEENPLPGVWTGKNYPMITSFAQAGIVTSSGKILQPVYITPLDAPDGFPINPGGGASWHDSAVLIGTWVDDGQGQLVLEWEMSNYIVGYPTLSTRGFFEPTVTEINNGQLLMVLRGSNDADNSIASRKWYSTSSDGGYTWSAAQEWKYDSGESFYSSDSGSQLIKFNEKIYWIGNVSQTNPHGTFPGYPLVVFQVDPSNLRLIKTSMLPIDDKSLSEPNSLDIMSFFAYLDRQDSEVVLLYSKTYQDWPNLWLGNLIEIKMGTSEPADCLEVWQKGFGLLGDINKDCHVDFKDFAEMCQNWMNCYAADCMD
jgi:hypothetical protein